MWKSFLYTSVNENEILFRNAFSIDEIFIFNQVGINITCDRKMYWDLLSKTYTQTHFCYHILVLVLWNLLHFTEKPIKVNSNNNSTENWKTYMEKVWNLFCQSWRLLVVLKCHNVTSILTYFPIILSNL